MEAIEKQVFKEGFWPGIPDEVYHNYTSMPFASRSTLKALVEGYSPAHVWHQLHAPTRRTDALEFGRILNDLVLRPSEEPIENRVILGPTKTRGAKAWQEMQAAHPDALIVSEEEFEAIHEIIFALKQHELACTILDRLGQPDTIVEGTGIWRTKAASDPEPEEIAAITGGSVPLFSAIDTPFPCWCKFRPDIWLPSMDGTGDGVMVDFKTTEDARLDAFSRSVFKFGYDLQAGFYCEGMKRLGYRVKWYVLLAVEKSPPYGVRVFRLMPDVIQFGWNRIREALRIFSKCQYENSWPNYEEKLEELALPTWAEKVIFE